MPENEKNNPNLSNGIDSISLTLLSHIPYPVMLINPDSSIRYVNPALEHLTGFTSPELIGQKVPYPYWPDGYSHKYSLDLAHSVPIVNSLERCFRKKDGQLFWVELTTRALEENGEIKFVVRPRPNKKQYISFTFIVFL